MVGLRFGTTFGMRIITGLWICRGRYGQRCWRGGRGLWSGCWEGYGAAEPREAPASLWYTRKVVAHGRHVVEQNLSVAQALFEDHREILPPGVSRDFPRDPQAEERVGQRLSGHR